ncbi:MAG: class I SAM-dependent methyltransferase [Desulfarculaceae bacterium]|nr:class I SAM-dependent methyltransferase [Desulfarculaceae bacterium]
MLEHFLDPILEIGRLVEKLNDNGSIYIEVPNIDYFSMKMLENAHVYYFNRRTLKHYMAKCKLSPLQETEDMVGSGIMGANFGVLFRKDMNISGNVGALENEYSTMKNIIAKEDSRALFKYAAITSRALLANTLKRYSRRFLKRN